MQKPLPYRILIFLVAILELVTASFGLLPNSSKNQVHATANSFVLASTTLSNARLSYKGAVATYVNSTTITTASSANPDNDTNNLFPNDIICFNPSGNICHKQTNHTISSIVSANQFTFGTAETDTIGAIPIVASQSATIAVAFKVTTTVPVGGNIKIYIPADATQATAQNGMPDATGFDSGCLGVGGANTCTVLGAAFSSDVAIAGGTFTTSGATYAFSTPNHVVTIPVITNALVAGTVYTVTIGVAGSNNYRQQFILPAPAAGHTVRGVSDSYAVRLTSDNGSVVLDDTTVKVNVNDGVLISATVPLSLSWTIGAVSSGTNLTGSCGALFTTDITTTATTVPFGLLGATDTFYRAAQTHLVSTNARDGYTLTVLEDGALKTADGSKNIPDSNCDGACSPSASAGWLTPANNGLAYTTANISGTDAQLTSPNYRTFDATTPRSVMLNAGKVSGSQIYMCYKTSVDATQDTGFYFNKLTYVATPSF